MKKINLVSMKLENFKGCLGEKTFQFADLTKVFGENAAGKTTLVDAFMWVLFDKDSQGNSKFQVRPLDSKSKQIDNIEIKAELLLKVDGQEVKLQKVQKQNWVKKRGTDITELKGNLNEYEIDDFPKQDKEYKEYISQLIGEDLFRTLTNPLSFVSKKWKDQRDILMKLITDIQDEDVIDSNPKKFGVLRLALGVHSIDDLMAKAKKAYSELKKKQDELPTRIDEASKSIVHIDVAEQELQKADLIRQIEVFEKKEEDSSSQFEEFKTYSERIMDIKMQMSDMEREANSKLIDQRNVIQKRIDTAEQSFKESVWKQSDAEKKVGRLQNEISMKEKEKAELLQLYYVETAKVFDESLWQFNPQELNCPMCGQPLPEDKAEKRMADFETKKEDAKNRFEKEKEYKVSSITENGKALTVQIKDANAKIEELKKAIETAKADKVKFNGEKNNAMAELSQIPQNSNLSRNEEYQALQKELEEMEQSLTSMNTGADYRKQLKVQKENLVSQLKEVEKIIASVSVNEKIEERIAELQEEQKSIGQLVADQEKLIFLYEEFQRAKMNMLSSRINAKFKIVNFKLFDMQINGGMKECCECMVDGVGFSDLNSGHKIIAGLDIINSLSELYEVQAPIWIDNAESINDYNLPKLESQVILLSVSDDKELRVEV